MTSKNCVSLVVKILSNDWLGYGLNKNTNGMMHRLQDDQQLTVC
jgi:hypothetical protein